MFNNKIELKIMKKLVSTNQAPNARMDAYKRCAALNELFNAPMLESFGLERTNETLQDLLQGGAESMIQLEKALSKELPLKSKLDVIRSEAHKQLERAKSNLRLFIFQLKQACAAKRIGEFSLMPEYIQLNEDGEIELNAVGLEELDNMENLYLTTDEQVEIYDLANTIKESIAKLQHKLLPYGFNVFGYGPHIMELRVDRESDISAGTISKIGLSIKKRFDANLL